VHESAEEKASPARHSGAGQDSRTPQAASQATGTASGMTPDAWELYGFPDGARYRDDDYDTPGWYPFP